MKLFGRMVSLSFALVTVLGTLNFACGGGSKTTSAASKLSRDAVDPNFYTTADARPSTYVVTLTDSASAAPASPIAPSLAPAPVASAPAAAIDDGFIPPDPATVTALATALCQQYGGQATEVWGESGSFLATGLTETQARAMSNDAHVADVSGDSPGLTGSTTQSLSTTSPDQFDIDRIDQRSLPVSHSFTYTSTGLGVNVYVADSGIRLSHSEFGGRADDVFMGWNGNPDDLLGHGTACASLVGGINVGVAKDVRLHSVKILGDRNQAYWSDSIRGFNWINRNAIKPAVMTCSVGSIGVSHGAAGAERAISSLAHSGVICVVSAGNANIDARDASFAKVSDVIAVGASDNSDMIANFGNGAGSNYGPNIAIFAPGRTDYMASFPGAFAIFGPPVTGNYTYGDGTSFATPIVAGVAAQYLQTHPTATNAQVKAWLISNATVSVLHNLPANTPNRLIYTNQ